MEHIENPDLFFQKAYHCLKENGKLFFITPNKKHYFVMLSRLFDVLNIKRLWIKYIMRARVDLDYGFKSYYLINEENKIRQYSVKYGFKKCEIIYIDSPKEIARYFPLPLKWIPYTISKIMKIINIRNVYFSDLICIMEK